MTLYEIDQAILECLDEETGEIIDIDRLNALEMARDQKISNVCCWIKDLRAESAAIKTEKQELEKRQKAADRKAEDLAKWVQEALGGQKFKDARVSVSYRKSKAVEFDEGFDINTLPERMKKITVEPRKSEIKEYLSTGATIKGCRLEEHNNMQIK